MHNTTRRCPPSINLDTPFLPLAVPVLRRRMPNMKLDWLIVETVSSSLMSLRFLEMVVVGQGRIGNVAS